MSEEEHNEGPLLEARLEGQLLNKVTLLPWNLLLFLYNTKVLKVEVLVTLTMLAKLFSMRLSEQYYYHTYGSDILRNTSFSFPDGPFCVTSDLIDAYTGSNHSYKLDESKSNHLAMYAMVAYTVPAVVMTVVLGSVTDRFGRKIGMIVPTLGLTLETFLAIIIVVYNLNPYYFILSSFTGGCFGSLSTILASSFSYVADISSPRWRSLRIGIVEAGVAFGGSAGQFFVGLWLDRVQCNYLPPLYFIAACFTFIAVYIVFFIPESLSYEKRQELQSKNRRGLRAYMEGFELFCGTLSLRTTWKLYVATIAMNVLEVNVAGDKLVSMYILKALPFDFNPFQIGIYQALRSASQGLANLVVMGVLVSLKLGDIWIIVAALVMHITGNLLLGFSRLPWEFYTSKYLLLLLLLKSRRTLLLLDRMSLFACLFVFLPHC